MNDERRFSKTKVESASDVNESENTSDFWFAKKCGNPTTFGFQFELCHKTRKNTSLPCISSRIPRHVSPIQTSEL